MDKLIRYLPRLIAIVAILFISMFALDAFKPDKPWLDASVEFAIHLIPSVVLLIALLIAWRHERLGGTLFILAGLAPFFLLSGALASHLIVGGPFFIAGLLFWVSYFWHNRE